MAGDAKIETIGPSVTVPPTLASNAPWNFTRRLARRLDEWLRDFPWLTRRRVVFYSGLLLFAYLVAAIGQLHNARDLVFQTGLSIGGDFVNPYAASVAARSSCPPT